MIRIFISYCTQDSSFADKLAKDLNSLGVNIFYAKWNIKVGDSIVEKINEALSSHDILLVILSGSSVKSPWVNKEINSSLMRQLSQENIRVFPILKERCCIPPLLADIKYADFSTDYQQGFKDLCLAWEEDLYLEEYVEIVEKSCPEINATDAQKELAIILKKIDPISNFRISIFSCINDYKEISEIQLLDQYDDRSSIFEELQYLIEDGLVEKVSKTNEQFYKINQLGENILNCFSYGFNMGILSPVCSQ